jgi:hypothetical protein
MPKKPTPKAVATTNTRAYRHGGRTADKRIARNLAQAEADVALILTHGETCDAQQRADLHAIATRITARFSKDYVPADSGHTAVNDAIRLRALSGTNPKVRAVARHIRDGYRLAVPR